MLRDIRKNPLLITDAYNLSHSRLKCNTDWEVSHMYNRDGEYGGMILYGFEEVVNSILSIQITEEMVLEASEYAKKMSLNFPEKLFLDVVALGGYFPIKVQSLPEGTWVPNGTPFAQIRNTIEGFGELVTWFEGVFMMAYFPSGCATEAYQMRKYLIQRKEQFGYDESFMMRFHSFGFRGHKSLEDAYWAGTAWNLYLYGTDDFHTVQHTPTANISSISALAHKVTQQFDNEFECFKHAIRETAAVGEAIVALVIDTYDAERVIREYTLPLARYAEKLGVHIVLRPDSGNTWDQAVEIYRVCKKNEIKNVSVIIGESMSFSSAKRCDEYMLASGVPLSFVSYGIGAGFYKHIERDTLGWAMKTSFSNGKDRMKFSMIPLKRSIPGKVSVVKKGDDLFVEAVDYSMESQYEVIYFYGCDASGNIYSSRSIPNWEDTQRNALKANDSQKQIYVSAQIRESINRFEKIYRK